MIHSNKSNFRLRSIILFTCCSLFIILSARAQKKAVLTSPDKNITFSVYLMDGLPHYAVSYFGQQAIDWSPLGLEVQNNSGFGKALRSFTVKRKSGIDAYALVVGKTSSVQEAYNQATFEFKTSTDNQYSLQLVVRVYNDGAAFRYSLPDKNSTGELIITDERSGFNLTGNPTIKTLLFDDNQNSHEDLYKNITADKLPANKLLDLPVLITYPDFFAAITEASLHNYPGMYLRKKGDKLSAYISPLPGQEEIKAKIKLPHSTPWRVIMLAKNAGNFIKSNLLTNLNEPPAKEDWSWLKPGKTAFHWWNGDVVPDTSFVPGLNFNTIKYYTDFCAANNIEYNSVIGYGGFAWYSNDWPSYGTAGTYADLTKPAAGLDMKKVCDYAKSKGVGIHVWLNWKALYPQLEAAFTQFEKWGVKGMMVDFLDRDDQEMINIQEEILQSAAAHHLFIQFHGAYKSTGMHRTYPNELTREGTYNYEQNKWRKKPVSPGHDLDIAFTRLIGGATDYHLGGFRAVTPEAFKTHYVRPQMVGTRAHMLAMYVVLESYLTMVADYPESYLGETGFDFIQKVPTVWDQTEVPAAVVDEHICVARRKGNDWYLGAINNNKPNDLSVTLDFLEPGASYELELFADAADVKSNPDHVVVSRQIVTSKTVLPIKLAGGGGFAAIVKRL